MEPITWTKSDSLTSWRPDLSYLYENARIGNFRLSVSTRQSKPNGQTWWTLSRLGMTDKSGWYTIAAGDQDSLKTAKSAVVRLYQKVSKGG